MICQNCKKENRTVILKPCKHLAVCNNCVNLNNCPVCKAEIKEFVKIYISWYLNIFSSINRF